MENRTVYLVVQREETKLDRVLNKTNTALKIAALAMAVAPLVIYVVDWGVATIKYKRRIKEGLKDGSVVKIDGKYYEVKPESEN